MTAMEYIRVTRPDPNKAFPNPNLPRLCFIKNVVKNPHSIAVGNPCQVVRKRFDDELIELLLNFRWWDKSIEEIESLMPILSCSDLEKVKMEIKARL